MCLPLYFSSPSTASRQAECQGTLFSQNVLIIFFNGVYDFYALVFLDFGFSEINPRIPRRTNLSDNSEPSLVEKSSA